MLVALNVWEGKGGSIDAGGDIKQSNTKGVGNQYFDGIKVHVTLASREVFTNIYLPTYQQEVEGMQKQGESALRCVTSKDRTITTE